MGEHWVGVRDGVKHGTLRHSDKKAVEVANKWEELVSFAALRLGRKIGTDVQEVLTAKEKKDLSVRIASIVETMVSRGVMSGIIRIPNTAGDIELSADIRAQQVVASISIAAPKKGRATTRINWLLRQLKATSHDVRVDSWGIRSRSSMSDLLSAVRKDSSLLAPIDDRDIATFTVSLARPMGQKRSAGKRSFIDSVLDAIDDFYGDVVQHLREWQATAPRLPRSLLEDGDAESESSVPEGSANSDPVANTVTKADGASGQTKENGDSSAP